MSGPTARSDDDLAYKEVMSSIVNRYTGHLLDVILDGAHVPFKQLASIGEAHRVASAKARCSVNHTRKLFESHVDALCTLYQQPKDSCNHKRAAMQLIRRANQLGAYLDSMIK